MSPSIPPAGKLIFAGGRFRTTGPVLLFDVPDAGVPTRYELPLFNSTFTMQRLKRQVCIGRYDLRTSYHEPCPHIRPLEGKEPHCPACLKAIGFAPAFYNLSRDQLSPQQREYNDTPHVVYLAWFGKSLIKVGTSSEERKIDRWLEQGALGASVIFQTADAYAARKLEEQVSREFGFSETVSYAQKVRNLFPAPDLELCRSELEIARWTIAKTTSEKVVQTPIFIGSKNYLSTGEFWDREAIDISGAKPLVASGTAIGLVGPNLLLSRQDGQTYSVRLKLFLSHVVQLSYELTDIPMVHAQQRFL